jgi:hypothetical protein
LGMRDSTRYTYTGQLICKKEKSATIELLGWPSGVEYWYI